MKKVEDNDPIQEKEPLVSYLNQLHCSCFIVVFVVVVLWYKLMLFP